MGFKHPDFRKRSVIRLCRACSWWGTLIALPLVFWVTISLLNQYNIPFERLHQVVRVLPHPAAENSAATDMAHNINDPLTNSEVHMSSLLVFALSIAMFLVEVSRGIKEILHYVRRHHFGAAKKPGGKRYWRSHEWAACATVLGMAVVPMLYYGQHAMLAVS